MEGNNEIDKFEEEAAALKALYDKAITGEQYQKVIDKSKRLKEEMEKDGRTTEEIGRVIQHGFWAEYYLVMKFKSGSSTDKFCQDVESFYYHYKEIEDVEGIIQYGYLLANIKGELRSEDAEARLINSDINMLALESGNIAFILRTINSAGNKEMHNEGNYDEAIKIFNRIEYFENIPEDAFRYAGNILNQRGISKIRGDISILGGMKDMIRATEDYYSKEKIPPLKHIIGVVKRMNEAVKKLEQS